jgi:hypothetical protein
MRLPPSSSPSASLALPLKAVIAGCREKGFTGAVTYLLEGSPGTLLFRCGTPVCAESGGTTGTRALEEMERTDAIVSAELRPYSDGEISAALLFNDACTVTAGPQHTRPATTVHAVRVGQKSRSATVKVVRTARVDDDAPAKLPAMKAAGKKDVLDPDSVKALKKLQKNFMTDASDLLKGMHMEHLIVDPEKNQDP